MPRPVILHRTIQKKMALAFILVGLSCILVAGFMGFRLGILFRNDPPIRNRQSDVSTIQEWMTLKYIAHTYGTPEPELEKALNIPPETYRKTSLSEIAQVLKQDQSEVIDRVRKTIIDFQARHPKPPTQ